MPSKKIPSPAVKSTTTFGTYFLLVRRSVGRGSVLQPDLHRLSHGHTRLSAAEEAENLERELNGGYSFAEAEIAKIDAARVARDPKATSELKTGAYYVAVQTVHQSSKLPGFETWGIKWLKKAGIKAPGPHVISSKATSSVQR